MKKCIKHIKNNHNGNVGLVFDGHEYITSKAREKKNQEQNIEYQLMFISTNSSRLLSTYFYITEKIK